MKTQLLSVTVACLLASGATQAQITVYEHERYEGRSFTAQGDVRDLRQRGFNDLASSVVVGGSQLWEICDNANYGGDCRVLRQGQYASLAAMGLNDRVTSLRRIGRDTQPEASRYAPQPDVTGDYRRRGGERIFEANVISTRAVYDSPQQRCWVEREPTSEGRRDARIPGALIGAVLGGILGHQVGGGSGRDVATVGGAVAGGVVGGRIGRGSDEASGTREVQRCADGPRPTTPNYWDVSYAFRGVTHRVQLTYAPGATIRVNRQGEPRA